MVGTDEYRSQLDYIYERRRRHPEGERLLRRPEQELLDKQQIVREKFVPVRKALPQMEQPPLEPLKRLKPQVIGSLFDRLKFLGERIEENNKNIQTREKIHQEIVADIDADVREKEEIMARSTDLDDRRNIKLDISVLRREKRAEAVQYWKDVVELKTELKELMEMQFTEKKIVEMFKEIDTQLEGT